MSAHRHGLQPGRLLEVLVEGVEVDVVVLGERGREADDQNEDDEEGREEAHASPWLEAGVNT